ncbi:hypothetical protein GCM10010149_78970 [Nonomuraea roseoviolacea subsp. roseoviolacea]|uniref:DUF4386 domain-containing protein n=1 Tax=Nonomuraea roseoviolacea subsp. carminata TaxID=160689 RepID=A0ABT1K8U1_9ACTN|nr:DUF4386 domain-containing protein [Nonomuraea roseoviolacea]MCP2350428.1 hypothetical protein [Nonomuraea roseoviolacea subsp. carminata]
MASPRKLATAAGVCYLVTHVTSIGGLILYGPVLHNADYIAGRGADTGVLLGALFEVVLAIAIVGTAFTLFPVARRHSEGLAVGYVGLRTLEAAVITVGIVSLLAVVTLRQHPPQGADPASLLTTGRALVAVHDWTFLLGPNFVCGANTVVMAYLMYRSQLVPRFIAVLGLVGGPLIFVSAIAELFGLYQQTSGVGALTAIPVFAWELTLAIWLITRGFKPSAGTIDATAASPAGSERR